MEVLFELIYLSSAYFIVILRLHVLQAEDALADSGSAHPLMEGQLGGLVLLMTVAAHPDLDGGFLLFLIKLLLLQVKLHALHYVRLRFLGWQVLITVRTSSHLALPLFSDLLYFILVFANLYTYNSSSNLSHPNKISYYFSLFSLSYFINKAIRYKRGSDRLRGYLAAK